MAPPTLNILRTPDCFYTSDFGEREAWLEVLESAKEYVRKGFVPCALNDDMLILRIGAQQNGSTVIRQEGEQEP
jgi:hypothetical protein